MTCFDRYAYRGKIPHESRGGSSDPFCRIYSRLAILFMGFDGSLKGSKFCRDVGGGGCLGVTSVQLACPVADVFYRAVDEWYGPGVTYKLVDVSVCIPASCNDDIGNGISQFRNLEQGQGFDQKLPRAP